MVPNQVIKGSLSAIILKLLENKGRMYGYEMTRAVRALTNDKISITEAALYPALHKLVEEDLLETTVELVEGRTRKYYALTKKGRKQTVVKIDALKDAINAVQLLLNATLNHG